MQCISITECINRRNLANEQLLRVAGWPCGHHTIGRRFPIIFLTIGVPTTDHMQLLLGLLADFLDTFRMVAAHAEEHRVEVRLLLCD